MHRTSAAVLCLLAAPLAAVAQGRPAPAAPAAGPTGQSSSSENTAADYSQESLVIERYITTARFENDGTGERDVVARIRIQSDAGVQELGELVFGYNSANEQTDVRYVRVRKPDGTVVAAGLEAVKEMTPSVARDAPVYTDYREKHISVPALAAGTVLEYEITTRLVTPLAAGEFWFQHNFLARAIVLDEQLEINIPEHCQINLQSAGGATYSVESGNGRTVYTWKHSNPAHPSDDALKRSSREPRAPDVQLTTFQSWADVARWYAQLGQGRGEPSPEIRAKAEELVGGLHAAGGRASDLEKIEVLYNYVAKNIRYVSLSFGLGRYQPHAAAEVFANQYGDCKDKHTLLAAMLRAAGFEADAVLISSARALDTSLPSPLQFDHVITAVVLGDELVWLDSTAEVAPFRLLAPSLRNKTALLARLEGVGRLVETPADPPFPSVQDVDIEGQVSELGKLTAHAHYRLRGDTELVLRLAFRRTPQTQWKELGQTILSFDGIQGEVTDVRAGDPTATQAPFEFDISFQQPNFLDWSSKRARASLPLVAIGLPEAPEDAAAPVHLGSPLRVNVRLKLQLPPAWVGQPPIAVTVSRDYAEFKSSYRFAEHILTAERSLDFKMAELPAERSSDYRAFARAVTTDEGQALNVENAAAGASIIPSTATADELFEAGTAALDSGNARAAVPLLERAVSLEPQHKQAWNALGMARLRVGNAEGAITAFRKQLEVNPFDERANNYLALAFEQLQKYPEALAAFRKQIEVNPLDPLAHAALGDLLLGQHSYSEAVPELEKAAILTPDNAAVQVALGQAYLNTGEQDKALASFEKGAELSQTPMVWNNIAYSLADHKLDLDKAQQYAESAVAATAANLRNMDVSHLTLDQFSEVVSIGTYWDTLGWVYFQKGDLARAGRYVEAAWLLNQHGEVGDHLAQIYAKLGQKERAIHAYALALAARHSVPETRARLMLLLGGNAQMDDLVKRARPELDAARSFPLKNTWKGKEDAVADFLILFTPGGAEGSSVQAAATQFLSGSPSLAPLAERLRSLDYGSVFPDATPVKLARRGTLSCSARSGDCTFVLITPEDVHTLN